MISDPMSGRQAVQASIRSTFCGRLQRRGPANLLYELFDEVADPKFTDKEAHFGLFNHDGNAETGRDCHTQSDHHFG